MKKGRQTFEIKMGKKSKQKFAKYMQFLTFFFFLGISEMKAKSKSIFNFYS